MQKPLGFIIFVLTIFFNSRASLGIRISEIKCEEYAEIAENPSAPNMLHYTVEIWNGKPKTPKLYSIGTLISDQFILSAYKTYLTGVNTSVTAANKNPSSTKIPIVSMYTQPIMDGTANNYSLVLLKLPYRLKLNSFNRPSCLWTHPKLVRSSADLLLLNGQKHISTIVNTIAIINSTVCSKALQNWKNIHSPAFCVKPTKLYKNYKSVAGSPVHVKQSAVSAFKNYHVLGLVLDNSNHGWNTILADKIFSHLDWIEELVWKAPENCGIVQHTDMVQLISHGYSPNIEEFPWHVALMEKTNQAQPDIICGGSILNGDTILTAAHCVHSKGNPILYVSAGYNSREKIIKNGVHHEVSKIIKHPNYVHVDYENDIAILKLTKSLIFSPSIQPICLPTKYNKYDGDVGYLPGWGYNEANEKTDRLQAGSFQLRSRNECRNSNNQKLRKVMNRNTFCAGNTNELTACDGDSGGGLVFKSKYQYYITGIVSLTSRHRDHINHKCNPKHFTLFTNVTQFNDWILKHL